MHIHSTTGLPRLVVLGTGFATFSLLGSINRSLYDITVISPRNHFLFTPLLPSTTVGTVEFRSIAESIHKAHPGVRFHQAYCLRMDSNRNTLFCEGAIDGQEFEVAYDFLFIGVGAVNNTFGIPGVAEHALFLKELNDARLIRSRIVDCFENASSPSMSEDDRRRLLHFVIVGGGPTGVEFAAEAHDFIRKDVRRLFPSLGQYIRITVVEASEQLLGTFDTALSAYTMKHFERQHIEVRTQARVTKVEPGKVYLREGEPIECGLVVWSTGNGATGFVVSAGLPKDKASRILVDGYLRVQGTSNIYSAGDCAVAAETSLPQTAQVAQQQGKYLGKALTIRARGKEPRPFRYKHMGMLAYIGSERALADLSSIKGRGFATYVFWRSAYFTRLVSMKNKVLVLFDWAKTAVFGRDVSRF